MPVIENEFRVIGPPGCIAGDAKVFTDDGMVSMRGLATHFKGTKVLSQYGDGDLRYDFFPVVNGIDSGDRECVQIFTVNGMTLRLTPDHKVFTLNGGWKSAAELRYSSFDNADLVRTILGWSGVTHVRDCGIERTFDISVAHVHGEGNFFANGILVHNCGKTTYLATQVKARVDRWCADTGLGPSQCQDVLVSSLTKAAAGEVLSRGLSLPDEQIGTLHSHAMRALGSPKLCVGPKQIAEWNKQADFDHLLSGGSVAREEDGMELGIGKYRGDSLHNAYTINRCRMTPREEWDEDVELFAKSYEKWKYLNDYLDYTDLIDQAFTRKVPPPGPSPSASAAA